MSSSDFEEAMEAVRDWRVGHEKPDLHQFFHGQRVVELGGDGTIFRIMGFDHSAKHGWQAKLARSPEDKAPFPLMSITKIKPVDQETIH